MFVESFPPIVEPKRELTLERLEHEICELAAHLNAQTCHWLGLVAEFDRREGWASWGLASCADWLAFKCAISAGTAREHVRVARAIEELPLIRAGFAASELSYSKVRALTRIATRDSEREMVEFAHQTTAAQLELAVRGYKRVQRLEDARQAHSARYLRYHWDDDGSLIISGRLPAEQGAVLMEALHAARHELVAAATPSAAQVAAGDVPAEAPARDGPAETPASEAPAETPAAGGTAGRSTAGDPPDNVHVEAPEYPAGARAADALMLMADSLLARGPASRTGGDRHQVVVHIDADSLRADRNAPPEDHATGHCELEAGPSLHPETIRRLACDASIVTIVEKDGEPLDVGRKTRSIPPALRRALSNRDRNCRFPGCNHHRYLQAHHIHHWAHGGHTRLDNLISLCPFHHRLLHEHDYTLHTTADGELEFRRPNGHAIPNHPPRLVLAGPGLRARNRANGHRITHQTNQHGVGETMDVRLAVDAIVTWLRPHPGANPDLN